MKRGWYLMHRGWFMSGDFRPEPFTEPMAFLWSIDQAAFEPHLQWFNGVQYPIDRGQFVTSIRAMAKAFGWGVKRTMSFSKRMEQCGKWTQLEAQPGTHGPTLLTVCNYGRFQALRRGEETPSDEKGEQQGAQLGNTDGHTTERILTKGNELGKEEEASVQRRPLAEMLSILLEIGGGRWVERLPRMTDKRRRGLVKIFDTYGLDGWRDGLGRALQSEFLGGPDPPGWFNTDFICNFDNFTKIYEGNYDRSFTSNRPEQRSSWLDANAALTGKLQGSGQPIAGALAHE